MSVVRWFSSSRLYVYPMKLRSFLPFFLLPSCG